MFLCCWNGASLMIQSFSSQNENHCWIKNKYKLWDNVTCTTKPSSVVLVQMAKSIKSSYES